MKKKFFTLLVLIMSISAWAQECPNNQIWYEASSKLPETTVQQEPGLHTDAFGVSVTKHEFANGKGIITFSGDLVSFGKGAFRSATLTAVTIPNSVTSLVDGAFVYCSALKSVTLSNSLTSLGMSVFMNCSALETITLPSTLTEIKNKTFYNCTGLKEITCLATTPPSIGDTSFGEVDKNIPVYVPKGCVAAYSAAENWKEFKNFKEIGGGPSEPLLGDANNDGVVDVADITVIASKILGNNPENFNAENADVNKDGKIDVADITATAGIILGS